LSISALGKSPSIWEVSCHSQENFGSLINTSRRRSIGNRQSAIENNPAMHFLTTSDFSRSHLEQLIDTALAFKHGDVSAKCLEGKSIALVFFNPSLRTRASMQVAIYELGGNPVVLEPGETSWTIEHRDGAVMDRDKTEHVAEFVRVLGRYCSAIGLRTFAALKDWNEERTDPVLAAFVKHSDVPVINLESAMHHPCQSLADMMTIREKVGPAPKRVLLTWAWHPKPLPMAVPNSFALAAAQMGHDLVIAHPPGYELDEELFQTIQNKATESGGSVMTTQNVNEAFAGADVVYAKSWGARGFYGRGDEEIADRAQYRDDWIVDERKMAATKNAIFMHCLPVRRNVIVTDSVIDSPTSVVIDEAENRLHVQKAILKKIVDWRLAIDD
jgi:N-acetylornithine carbamoyltransferase